MAASQPITETIILHLKEGVNLENVASGADADTEPAVQAFAKLTRTVKAQRGFIRQFWGHHVEHPRIFVWSIDWETFDHNAAFVNSKEHLSFTVGMGQVFDLETAAPLTTYTRFTSDAVPALAAPVTEVAFLTLPNDSREDAKTAIEHALVPSMEAVVRVGKSTGGATGWVFDAKNTGDAVPEGESIALHAVFGYASVDDHVRWRHTPEHAQVIEDLGRSPLGSLGLKDANMPGGYLFVPDSSMFHVTFRPGD